MVASLVWVSVTRRRYDIPERALEDWVGRYVSMRAVGEDFRGRVETVGSDGIIFQPASTPQQTEKLPPRQFLPWHTIRFIELADEQAPGNEG